MALIYNSWTGKYRNKYTDAVEFKIRTTANTNIFYFNKVLLAIKEDAPPFAMDPITLETFGVHDFNGQLPSLTFTAHPKLDPQTGELVCFGYEAMGDGTPDICYYSIEPDGTFNQTFWLVSPVVGMIHDFAVTENWARHHLHISGFLVAPLTNKYNRSCFQSFLKFAISIDSSKVENIGNGIRVFRFI